MAAAPQAARGEGTGAVLARLSRPYEPGVAAAILLGLPVQAGRQLVGSVLATCDESEDLLDAMPRIVRSLSVATTDRPERCHGELRGPVLWSETMSARSASAGDPGLFVCAATTKAYDTDENRVLKAALWVIARAGREASYGVDLHGDEVLRRARQNEQRALRLLEHHTLSGVRLMRASSRSMRRTRAGRRRSTYQPALALLGRAREPIHAIHLHSYAPRATIDAHDLLAASLAALDERHDRLLPLRTSHGQLVAGPIRYQHASGVTIGGAAVTSRDHIDSVLDRALDGPMDPPSA